MSDIKSKSRLSLIRTARSATGNTNNEEEKTSNEEHLIIRLFMGIECDRLNHLLREKSNQLDFAKAKMAKMEAEIQRDKLMKKEHEQLKNRAQDYEVEIEMLRKENGLLMVQSNTKFDKKG